MRIKNLILFIFLLLFFSCDKDGTIFTGAAEEEVQNSNIYSGYGCSGTNLC